MMLKGWISNWVLTNKVFPESNKHLPQIQREHVEVEYVSRAFE